MEGGGILQYNYSGDHLATRAENHEDENNKQWLACGFNEFGQLVTFKDERKLRQFEEFKTRFTPSSQPMLLSCSWSYLAAANERSLQLQGFISSFPKTVKTITTESTIKSLASCDQFCLILLYNGKLFKLLPQCDAQLEEVKFQGNEKPIMQQKQSNYRLKIDFAACGNNIMLAIGNSNEVFSGTTQVHQFPKHIRTKQLVCGFEHALLLTSNGDIYSCGNGLRGQLGQVILRVEEKPILLEALAGIKITYITASGWHCAAISAFGDLYTWGFNSNGQLGLRIYKNDSSIMKEPAVYPLPQLVDLPSCGCSESTDESKTNEQNCFPIKVVAGARHTILLMSCGSLYATGWNAYGQLGLMDIILYCDAFRYVLKVEKCNVDGMEIVCGNWCTLIGTQSGIHSNY